MAPEACKTQRREINLTSLLGEIRYKRWCYRHDECQCDHAPIDLGLGRIRSVTGGVASLIGHMMAESPPRRVEKKLTRDHGIQLSVSTVDNIAKMIGERLNELQKLKEAQLLEPISPDRPSPPTEPVPKGQAHVTEVDAVKVRFVKEEGGWHDAKVGLCDRLGDKPDVKTGIRPMVGPRRYVAEMTNAESFAPRLKALGFETGIRNAEESLFLGDGAEWIDNIAQNDFAWSTRILDPYHVDEHLYKAAYALHGEGSMEGKAMAENMSDCFYLEGGVDKVCAELKRAQEQIATSDEGKRKIIQLVHDYIDRHRDALNYKQFREYGWIIGSGAVEGGGCKTFIEGRFKLAGQAWTKDGFHKILAVRQADESDQWDKVLDALHIYPSRKPRSIIRAA